MIVPETGREWIGRENRVTRESLSWCDCCGVDTGLHPAIRMGKPRADLLRLQPMVTDGPLPASSRGFPGRLWQVVGVFGLYS